MKSISIFLAGVLIGVVIADKYTKMSLIKKNDLSSNNTTESTPTVEEVINTPKQ